MGKKILFIVSSWWAGGTNSAMSSIYNCYDRDKWDISIYIISNTGTREVPYKKLLLKSDSFLSAYFCNRKEFKKGERHLYYWAKIIKRIARTLHFDLESRLFKRVARRIESEKSYDTVVAFIEGYTTRFGSYFTCPNKVAWIHCDYNKYLPAGKSEEHIYARYSKIVTVSEYTTKVFQDRYPALAERTLTIYNLFDKEGILNKSEAQPDDDRFQASCFTLLSVGRVHPVKRFSSIPSIASQLKKSGIAFKWFIIGPSFDDSELEKLRKNIKAFQVDDCVIWLGGKANPYPYFKMSNLYVCTSLSEACPMVFNEARVLGIPVVSTDFPSSYEFIENGRTGAISSFSEIGETIKGIIENPIYYHHLKEGALSFDYDNQGLLTIMDSIF